MYQRRVRFGVIGLGHFAQAAILPAFRTLRDVELAALVSGSGHKREALRKRYDVPVAVGYDELDGLLDRGELDAVYIALPPDLHAEVTIRCAQRGIHVLCEKPMAPNERDCRAMITACATAGVQLMIAYRLHFESANLTAIELGNRGDLGGPRYLTSSFSQQVREGNVRTERRAGSGPLWDMGVYCVNAARYLFRCEPFEVAAMSFTRPEDPRFAHIPEQVGAILRFPDERCATFVSSFGAFDRARYELACTRGVITLDHAYEYVGEMTMRVETEDGAKERTFHRRDQIAAEVEYFARCVLDDAAPEPSGHEGLADVRVLEAIERSIQSGRIEPIEAVDPHGRPDLGLEMTFRPHREPRLVDVQSPTR